MTPRKQPSSAEQDLADARAATPHAAPGSWTVEPLTWSDVRPLAARAARDHVSITQTKGDLSWFGVRLADQVIGCGGLLVLSPTRYRLRAGYVVPTFRSRGIGTAILDHRLSLVPQDASVDAWSFQPSHYTARGWTTGTTNRFGATHCTLTPGATR